jgi:hypothetical protein
MGLLTQPYRKRGVILIRSIRDTTMTSLSTRLLTAATAAIAGALLLADVPRAQARNAGAKTAAAGTHSADGYTPKPVIRDHRKNPQQPWALPPHHHRHGRR